MALTYNEIAGILEDQAESLLGFKSHTFEGMHTLKPAGDFVDKVTAKSDRNQRVLNNLQWLYSSGRLADTGYLSILPVDQGIEHSAGASFAANPMYFDPENIVKLALEGGSNAVASTFGVLGLLSRKYAHKIPFIVKINHNELLTYPNKHDQIMFGQVQQAYDMGAAGIGATIYFGSEESSRQIIEVSEAFAEAHRLGMFTVLWCYTRNKAFKQGDTDYHTAADLTAQANHLGATIQADIVKQKLPTNNGGYKALNTLANTDSTSYGKLDGRMYSTLSSEHLIDLTKYQVANGYMGKVPLLSSGGPSSANDLKEAVMNAVINKRAGGSGLILGRKAFQKDFESGIKLLHTVQDVYLCEQIDLA